MVFADEMGGVDGLNLFLQAIHQVFGFGGFRLHDTGFCGGGHRHRLRWCEIIQQEINQSVTGEEQNGQRGKAEKGQVNFFHGRMSSRIFVVTDAQTTTAPR